MKFGLSDEDLKDVRDAIARAERVTSGELRVHIESRCKEDIMDHSAAMFAELHMHETALRNGVLICLATKDRKFAILGDAGIHLRVGDDFWKRSYDQALPHLKNGEWGLALVGAIDEIGRALAEHFPVQPDDVNELSDDISFGR